MGAIALKSVRQTEVLRQLSHANSKTSIKKLNIAEPYSLIDSSPLIWSINAP